MEIMLQVIEVKTLITLASVRTHPNPCVPNAPQPLFGLLASSPDDRGCC